MSFDNRAKDWDKLKRRRELAFNAANKIKELPLKKNLNILDIGVGTALLASEFKDIASLIVGVDTSIEMLKEFKKKMPNQIAINKNILEYEPDIQFDLIISSMTLHHIKDIPLLFKKVYKWLKKDGFFAFADLAKEDGTFHTNGNEGVFHFGFFEDEIIKIAKSANFKNLRCDKIYTIVEDKPRPYDILLWSGQK